MNRDYCSQLDQSDEFAAYRGGFLLDDKEIYLCGHSLGPMPRQLPSLQEDFLEKEWGLEKVRGWNTCQWVTMPQQVGALLAPIIGAAADEVIVADSTSINLFKLLSAACAVQTGKNILLTEADNFPADLYIAQGLCQLLPHLKLIVCERQELISRLHAYGEQVALLMLTHCSYGNSQLFDMRTMTQLAHQQGALVLFDLAHSAGIMPLSLAADEVDLAVGCTYKYLNGGPGAPAFLYAAKHLQDKLNSPLQGWLGHRAPFNFETTYQPAAGMQRFICGTPPMLSLVGLKNSLALNASQSLAKIRHKSQTLSALFIDLMTKHCEIMQLGSPKSSEHRGAHVTYYHEEAYAISRALLAHDVVIDYRAPNKIRFSFPAYVRYVDVFDTVAICAHILQQSLYKLPQYHKKTMVT